MNYLLDAMIHLGVYYTPARILALGYGSGKTQFIYGNPPFRGGIPLSIETINGSKKFRLRPTDSRVVEIQHKPRGRWAFYLVRRTPEEAKAALLALAREVEEK